MSGFSTYLDNKILGHVFNGVSYPTPAKYWGLCKSVAGLTENSIAAVEEVTGGNYVRVKAEDREFTVAEDSHVKNKDNVDFPVATANWGTITHVAIFDAPTGGNVLAWGAVRNPLTLEERPTHVQAGDQFIIRAQSSTIRIVDSNVV